MEKGILDQFRLTVAERRLGIYGIRVERKNGDRVTHFWRSDDKVNLYSASKTFTSLAVGMCVDDGKLKVTDRVLDFFPEYRAIAAPGSEEIAVRDLLHMSSGKLEFWFGDLDRSIGEKDWAELFFRVPVTKKPGTVFCYSNACTYMLGRIVEKISGKNVRDFLVPRLFEPFGVFNPQWHADPQGHTLGATELFLTLEEFSRLGAMFLNGGEYGGKRIVSGDYLRMLYEDAIPNPAAFGAPQDAEGTSGYGYQVWHCSVPGVFRADGMYGQFCIFLPEQETAVTITSHEEHSANDLIRAVFSDIVPRL